MSKFIIIGLTPQGLALLRLLSRAGHQVFAFSNTKKAVGLYSKYGEKLFFSDIEDLKVKIASIVRKSGDPVKCIIASGELLALILEEYPELYAVCDVESGPFDLVKMLSHKSLMYDFATTRGLKTAKFSLLSNFYNGCLEFPVILKRNYEISTPFKIKIIESEAEFIAFKEMLPAALSRHILVQELIAADPVLNLSCQVYLRNGKIQFDLCCIQERRISSGITSFLVEVESAEIRSTLVEAASRLFADTKYNGFAELEFLYSTTEKNLYFIEVNTRPCGLQSSLHHKFKGIESIYNDNYTPSSVKRNPERLIWINILRDIRSRVESKYLGKPWQFFLAKKDIFDWRDPVPFFMQLIR